MLDLRQTVDYASTSSVYFGLRLSPPGVPIHLCRLAFIFRLNHAARHHYSGKRSNRTRRSLRRYRSFCRLAFVSEFLWVERASRKSCHPNGANPSHSHAAGSWSSGPKTQRLTQSRRYDRAGNRKARCSAHACNCAQRLKDIDPRRDAIAPPFQISG